MDKYLHNIIQIAQQDDNIRSLVLYGSRVDRDAVQDRFQDYDLYCIVKDVAELDVCVFGEPILSFVPSDNYPELFPNKRAYLMLFGDDVRIDLTICTLETFCSDRDEKQLMQSLLDKDGTLPHLNGNDNSSYWVTPMNEILFLQTCSEFFWEVQNMVKGLKRDELSYAMFIRDISLRDMLNRFVDQSIGLRNGFQVGVGTLGKYRKRYMPEREYTMYEKTYLSNSMQDRWDSLICMIDLFSCLGRKIASSCGYSYPESSETVVREYVCRIVQET